MLFSMLINELIIETNMNLRLNLGNCSAGRIGRWQKHYLDPSLFVLLMYYYAKNKYAVFYTIM